MRMLDDGCVHSHDLHMATETIGTRIRKRRQALRMTQPELAARVGVNRSAVSAWERDVQYPLRHLGALEEVLGVTLTEPRPGPDLRDPVERRLWDKLTELPEITDEQRKSIIKHRRRQLSGEDEPDEEPARARQPA